MLRGRGVRRLIACGLVAPALAAVEAPGVSAQDGVFIDPDRPAGTEYEIPLDSARRGASPGSTEDPGTAASAPRFGSGVAAAAGASSTGGDSDAGRRDSQARGSGGDTHGNGDNRGGADTSGELADTVAAVADPADGPLPAGLITAGIALSVLVLGGVAGLTVRRIRG